MQGPGQRGQDDDREEAERGGRLADQPDAGVQHQDVHAPRVGVSTVRVGWLTNDTDRYTLHICKWERRRDGDADTRGAGDVGGQRTLRAYWRNYFEQTDGVAWVVDSCDRARMRDCREELQKLLQEDVSGAVECVRG